MQFCRIARPEILLIAIVILTGLRPGDTPWVNDESIIMEMAIRYNHTASDLYGFHLPFTPSPFGLQGTRGERYGPLPIWLDQLFLVFTTNLKVMTVCRAAIFSSVVALSLYSLARTLRLSPWYAVVTMLSPWLWCYSRSLWDSSWCVPLSAALFASYAQFLQGAHRWAFRLSIVLLLLLPMVHLMPAAIVLPIALHMAIFRPRDLWRWKWHVVAIVVVWACLFWPYLRYSLTHFVREHPQSDSAWRGWWFPLLGGTFLTLGVAGTMPGNGWQTFASGLVVRFFSVAGWFTCLALLFVWLGMILVVPRAWRAARQRGAAATIDHLCLVALAIWVFQTGLDGMERIYGSAHYHGATWPAYVFFAWMGVSKVFAALSRPVLVSLAATYAACLIGGTLIVATAIARDGGTQGIYYGPSIDSQIDAVRKIQRFSEFSQVDVEFSNWRQFPWALTVLKKLNPPAPGPRPAAHLVVRYRNAYPGDARLEVIPMSPD